MAKLTTILRRVPAMSCVAALVSGHAFASDPNEYTLAPSIAPQAVTVEQVAPQYIAPAPAYVAPEVTVYNPPVTDIYVEPAPAPEIYEAPVEADPEPVYMIQEAAPVEPVQYVTEPVIVEQPVVYSEPVTTIAQPAPQPLAPAPQPVAYTPPPVPAGPAPTVVAAPVAPVLTSGGLGNAGLIAAGVGAAALIGIAAIALSDDDDDDAVGSTGGT